MGVNRSTVGSLVSELSDRGFVCERAPASQMVPGRPSPVVEPREDGPTVLAIEIATDTLAAAVVGLGGSVVSRSRVDQARAWRTPSETLDHLMAVVEPVLAGCDRGESICAVGISVPGLVRRRDGFVHIAPNLGWRDVPLADLVQDRLGLVVPVLSGNDADLATLAEHTRGAGVGLGDFICLWGEAGMGAGIVAGGRQLTGAAGYAGEVGHLPVNPDGRECHCGARGCWETEVGEDALLRRLRPRAAGGAQVTLESLLADADRGDAEALEAIAAVGRWLGVGLVGLVNIFNPSGIALGGLYGRLYPYVRGAVTTAIAERAIRASRGLVTVTPAALGADSALLGAAELAFAPSIADPTRVPRPGRPLRAEPSGTVVGGHTAEQYQGGGATAQRSA